MFLTISDWIKISQLQSIGIEEELFYTLVILFGIAGCYVLIRPISVFLLSIRSETLLRYVLSGLLFIVLFFIVVLLNGHIELITYQLLKLALQVLAILGLFLCVIHLFRNISKRKKRV
ncbi:hypothetical protein [Ornithinibacillus bavariensis]|uniref:Uncharacterized protein n=1 Tax=Ornithinibacillus bavariensis TaxID=545502 RepID=A0A919X6L6_9BACI|nr:hypothetical protein [Ornithinibacillus bavariensis]GIO25994.1 hypothetical protein J43TS3_06050 [Ornithinibacillus bavariensis]HAM81281.1 hypothetical protein [Ornithinibacillus sp.]